MFKRKYIMQALLAVMMVLTLAAGIAGCAGQSQPTAGNSASANTTGGGQTGSTTANTTDGGEIGSAPKNTTSNAAGQPGPGLERIKKVLAGLVTKGTFTQDQADKVTQAYSQAYANGYLPADKLWIDEAKYAALVRANKSLQNQGGSGQQNSGQIENPILAPLVSNGTLNEDQVNAIIKAISQDRGPKSDTGGPGSSDGGGD